jgi:hypothetical protein
MHMAKMQKQKESFLTLDMSLHVIFMFLSRSVLQPSKMFSSFWLLFENLVQFSNSVHSD